MRALRNPRPKQMDPISTTLGPRARVPHAAGARPGSDEPMSQFPLLGAGFIHPEISPADRQECYDRPTGEISGLGSVSVAHQTLSMAPAKSTKPTSGSCELRDAPLPSLDLNLPDAERFHSMPPVISLAKMIERNRQFRQWFPAGLPSAAKRWQARVIEEFRL